MFRILKFAVLINFASSQSFLNPWRGGNVGNFGSINQFDSARSSFNPQSTSLDRIGTSNTFYNTFQNHDSKVQNNPTFSYTRTPDRYPTNEREARYTVQSSPNAFGSSQRSFFNSFENRGTHIQNNPTFQVTEFGDNLPKTERDAQRYLDETRSEWTNRRNPFDSKQTQEQFKKLNLLRESQRNGGVFTNQIEKIQREIQALNSNRYVPKNLCSEFALSGFESLGVDPYYDTTVESRETIKARLKNLDNFSNPIKTTGQSARPAADKFNTFSNQNSFIENEPRYVYVKGGNFFPSTKIGREAELKAQEIISSEAGKTRLPQTAEGRKFLREQLQHESLSPQIFRESNTLTQVMNENREVRRRLRSQFCDEKYVSFNNRNTQIQNKQRHLVTDNLFEKILPSNAEDLSYLLRKQAILWRNIPTTFRGFF